MQKKSEEMALCTQCTKTFRRQDLRSHKDSFRRVCANCYRQNKYTFFPVEWIDLWNTYVSELNPVERWTKWFDESASKEMFNHLTGTNTF